MYVEYINFALKLTMKKNNIYILILIYFCTISAISAQVAENPFSVSFSSTQITEQNPFNKFISIKNNLQKGNISENWSYWFHGDACEFENSETKQFVYVKINRNGNYGVIDNYNLYKFILTTKSLEYVTHNVESETKFNEIIMELEKENIIINIDENEFIKTRVLNYNLIN